VAIQLVTTWLVAKRGKLLARLHLNPKRRSIVPRWKTGGAFSCALPRVAVNPFRSNGKSIGGARQQTFQRSFIQAFHESLLRAIG
jgi:hypothetical protein